MAGLRWVLDLLASSGPVVAAPPKQGEVLLHLSPENDRWNKMALGIRDADVPAAVVVPSRETPPQGFAALRGAIPAEESDEDFNAACASLRDTTSPASSLSRAALERPKIICLCGSTKFIDHFAIQTWELELTGAIVLGCTLLPSWYCPVRDHFAELQGVKGQRDEHHLRKIDLADEVLVLNIGGYIGESTRNEIAYATKTGKPVRYLEPLAAPERRDE
jgi:hypothetical protein